MRNQFLGCSGMARLSLSQKWGDYRKAVAFVRVLGALILRQNLAVG